MGILQGLQPERGEMAEEPSEAVESVNLPGPRGPGLRGALGTPNLGAAFNPCRIQGLWNSHVNPCGIRGLWIQLGLAMTV